MFCFTLFSVVIIVKLTAVLQSVFAAFPVLTPELLVADLQNSELQAELVVEFQQFCLSG